MYDNILEAAQNIYMPREHNWTPRPEDKEIVKQIRNEYARKSFGYDYDDLEQELWVKVYEVRSSYDDPHPAFMAKCLRNHIADWFRKEIKRTKTFKSRASFEQSEDWTEAMTPSSSHPDLRGATLKIYLIAYYLFPDGLTVEMKDEVARIFSQLSSSDISVIHRYSHDLSLSSNDRKCMSRLISKYEVM
jgi:DNA-directed RNA polymerase specialized sigma24 family protein